MRSPVAAVGFLIAGSLVLAGCSLVSGSDDAATPKATSAATSSPVRSGTAWTAAEPATVAQGGTLRLAAATLPTNFNPLQADAAGSDAARILAPTTGSPIRITADGGWEVDPDYATSVEVTDRDPLTVEVELNPRAVWQGGTAITARDMIAFWKALNGSDDSFEVASTVGFEDISSVEEGDTRFSYTVTFDRPTAEWPLYIYPQLPANVSSSPKLFNSGFRTSPISSNGPYVVDSIDTERGVITERPNPRWWGDRPKLSAIRWTIADPDVQAKAYVAGELDAVDLQASTYAVARDAGTVQRTAGVEWSQVTLNGARGPLQDTVVRRAVAKAIDRAPIARAAARALGASPAPLGSLLLVPGQRGYTDSSESIAYDPKAAADLLAEAGWVTGADGVLERKGKRLTLTMPVPTETPANSQRAASIVKDLAAVGIEVTVRSVPAATFYDASIVPLDFDLVTYVRRGSPFPITAAEPVFYPIDSPQNFTGIGSQRIGRGWDTVLGTLDDALRERRVAKLDEWLFQDVPMVPLAVTPIAVAVRSGLVNYGASQFEQPDWTTVGFLRKK